MVFICISACINNCETCDNDITKCDEGGCAIGYSRGADGLSCTGKYNIHTRMSLSN